jgi:hypothetical protein
MKTFVSPRIYLFFASICLLGAQEVTNAPPAPLTPDEAKTLQLTLAKAIATPKAKEAEAKLKAARDEVAKASKEYQEAIEQSAVEIEPKSASILDKTHKLQQDMQARRASKQPQPAQVKSGAPRVGPAATSGTTVKPQASVQPRQVAYQSGSKPSDFLDSWSALAVIFCLGVIGVLVFRKR